MENGFEGGFLTCTVMVENLADTGSTLKKMTHRNATLQLGRNEFRDVMLRLEAGKKSQRYSAKEVGIHKKFAKDGKATVRLDNHRVQFLLSNCPPDKLILFLKTLSTKVQCRQLQSSISDRKRLLSELPRSFQEISPLNVKELQTVHNIRAKAEEKANPDIFTPKGKTKSGGLKRKRPELGSGKENMVQKGPKFAKTESGAVTLKPSVTNMVVNQPVALSKEQMRVLEIVKQGHSIFFTGSAGTGKSFLLRRIIGALPPQSTFATASTGVAACHIGGTTLHAFAGIRSGKANIEQCVELASRPAVAKQWRSCKHLIIDEVSMVDGDFFDKLETVARVIRKTDAPFGGIQVILCGDFLQLPPVTKGKELRKFAFQSKAWRRCVEKNLELMTVRRQSDQKFIKILQDIRVGRCSQEVCDTLTATARHSLDRDGIMATRLCTHKEDVDHINQIHLGKLNGTSKTYEASDSDPMLRSTVDVQCPVKYKLELKEGAQVMLAKNLGIAQGLVNGARGVVTGFEAGVMGYPVVKFRCGVTVTIRPVKWTFKAAGGIYLTRRQLPLKLAWAISIHKSQGMSLDCVEISLSRVFESGQSYVALSRARSLEGLRVIDFDKRCVRANPDVLQFYRKLQMSSCLQQTHMENYYSTQAAPF